VDQQTDIGPLDEDTDPEWAQLREMEQFLRLQRTELLQQGAPDSDNEDWDSPQWPEEREDLTDVKEDDSLEDADMAFITSILESFSKPKAVKHNTSNHSTESFCAIFPSEGARMPTDTEPRVPLPKFNYNSTIKNTTAEEFSCFPAAEEEGTKKFPKVSESQDQTNTEKASSKISQSICSITKSKNNPFATWRPFIPNQQEPAYQSSSAQPWWQVSSAPPCSFPEPTLTTISSLNCFPSDEAIKPTPLQTHQDQTRNQHQIQQSP
jgi:hypothetical protein